MKVLFIVYLVVFYILNSTSGKTTNINKGDALYCLDPFTGNMHPVGSSWPSTAFCGNFSCRAKLVPKKDGYDNVPEIQENHTEENEIEKIAGTDHYSGRDDSEVRETGIKPSFSKHGEDDGFEEIDEACNALVKEAEDPEIKSDIKRLVELYKASQELTKTFEDTETEENLGTIDNDNIGNLGMIIHDEMEETTAHNFEQFKPLKDYYFSPEMANKNFEAIYKEYNEYLNKYYAFYPEYRKELDGLLSKDDIEIQNNCIRSRDDSEASASKNDACEICALESQDNFDFQLPEIETRIQTEVKPKPQTYPGYFYDEESNSYVYYYGPNQPYVDVRFGTEDEVNPEEENLADESDECEDEDWDNDDDEEVDEEDINHFPIKPEIEENDNISEDGGLRIFEEKYLHNASNQIVQHSPNDKQWYVHNKPHQVDNDCETEVEQGDMSVSYYKYDKALGKYVLKVPKDEEEYEKFRQEYMKVYNLSDSNSNEQFEDMNAYEEYFRANFAEHVNDTVINKTDSQESASSRKVVMLNHGVEDVNTHYMSGSTLNIPTFEYKMLQANQDGHNDVPKQETCSNGNQIIPRQENFYQSGQNCLQHQESYHDGHEAYRQPNWYQEIPKDLSKQEEFEDKVNINLRDDFLEDLLKPSMKVQTPKLNRFERLNGFLKSRTSEDGDLLKPTIRLPKLRKPRPLSPIFVPSLIRNRRSAQPNVKGINDEGNGEKWETFITVEGCPETLEPGKFKMGDPDKLFPACCPQKINP